VNIVQSKIFWVLIDLGRDLHRNIFQVHKSPFRAALKASLRPPRWAALAAAPA